MNSATCVQNIERHIVLSISVIYEQHWFKIGIENMNLVETDHAPFAMI